MSQSWQCPYCNHYTVSNSNNFASNNFIFDKGNKFGLLGLHSRVQVCSNPNCGEFVIESFLRKPNSPHYIGDSYPIIFKWKLKPNSIAKPLPDYIPVAIKEDYEEACAIVNLSPKSSATLARRCLQGMIRDFWGIKKSRLVDEINALKDKVDIEVWESIEVIRKVGNIGAHMESDINQIIDVEPHEAELLISLIETLIEEWYVSRYERERRLEAITNLGRVKEEAKIQLKTPSIQNFVASKNE